MSVTGILSRFGSFAIHRQHVVFNHLPVCTKIKYFSNKPAEPIIIEGVPASALPQKKTKRPIVPRITLISGKDDITITTLEDANKIASRRNLKLVKIVDLDTKTDRPVYKLMSSAEYASEDIKHRKEKKNNAAYKGEKVLMLSSVIADHDLQTQVKKVEKWVAKEYEVRVTISANSGSLDKCEEIYTKIEKQLQNKARLLQKRTKGLDIRFQVIPPKRDKSTAADGGGDSNNSNL